jgi:multiple antibiotic resistance protein
MNFSANGSWEKIGITISAFAVLCFITGVCFTLGQRLVSLVGDSGLSIVTRLMGLIMTVIGVQMLIAGTSDAFPISD